MPTKLIKLEAESNEDDTPVLIEIEAPPNSQFYEEISAGSATVVDATFDKIQPLLVKACRPVVASLKEISQEADVEKAEVQMGLSFEMEGNVYITKFKANANLIVKIELKSKR
ncbi:hypothetical protein H6F87_28690 [Cyanobacteria bacterium FACHB-502]|nr:hypothetical protein [Cyanobacteria bacterium FACHB-502]